jgi:hypothetical protein
MRSVAPPFRVVGIAVAVAVIAWACVATLGWNQAQVECFWALRDLKDQRRDVDTLTEEVRELHTRVRTEKLLNSIIRRCHREAVDEMLAMAQEHRTVTAASGSYFLCPGLEL